MKQVRNEFCNCGSGRKYKKCCLHTHEQKDVDVDLTQKRQFVKLSYLYKDVPISDFYELQQIAASEVHANLLNNISSKKTHPTSAFADSVVRVSNGIVLNDSNSFVQQDIDGIYFPNYDLIKKYKSVCTENSTPPQLGNSYSNEVLALFEQKLVSRFGKKDTPLRLRKALLHFAV